MTRDEILAKNRADNEGGDERQIAIYRKTRAISYSVGLILGFVIQLLILALTDSNLAYWGCNTIFWSTTATNDIAYAIMEKKKHSWLATFDVVLLITAVVFFAIELVRY